MNRNDSSECIFCLFFPSCSKAISKAYEEYVLSVGNLDERIFLGEDAEEEIGTLCRCLNTGSGAEAAERGQMRNVFQQHFDKVGEPSQGGQGWGAGCRGPVVFWQCCECLTRFRCEEENSPHTYLQ